MKRTASMRALAIAAMMGLGSVLPFGQTSLSERRGPGYERLVRSRPERSPEESQARLSPAEAKRERRRQRNLRLEARQS